MTIHEIVNNQRTFFKTGKTKNVYYRIYALKKLQNEIKKSEKDILAALKKDLNKSDFEGYMTEIGMVLDELNYCIKHAEAWAKPKNVLTPLAQFPSRSFVVSEPYGVVLIMAPWNYPFQLCIEPLIGAIVAGNCAILKPSAYAKYTSEIIAKIIKRCFTEDYVTVIQGGRKENEDLLKERFDYIFFTGGTEVGKIVMEAAAKHITPISLELGGKSPCIVDASADIKLAAKRVAFGKFLNAGQTCVAPDYLFIHKSVKDKFVLYVKQYVREFFGENPIENENLPKIINKKHYNRLINLMENEEVLMGGIGDELAEKIAPTLLDHITSESKIMQEEIFGPILPILEFDKIDEVINYIVSNEKPLACYLFSTEDKIINRFLNEVSFGGGCINDTIIHLATSHMGFGGVGMSGMGSYHGYESFRTFSHRKSIVKKANWLDIPLRYHPYTDMKLKLIRKFLK
ncbi:aldehyde dehydrogenase [Clostridium sp. Marseille-P299]|uniref:aldehyde dehydrogenase n=1 Tax=Clostridium sp. Marseille-P299 TaxID=1805477 RepID=UPI0008318863|nr:aldehyde dehydrogenase [Clostridium sp. Marseille-P299]